MERRRHVSRVQRQHQNLFNVGCATAHHTIPTIDRNPVRPGPLKPRDTMFSGSNTMVVGGIFNNYQSRVSRGMDILVDWVATGAFHNSDELYDAPKCHPRTRIAVLEDIMKWVDESESARDNFMLWLFGAAGAGKSAIAKRVAEIAAGRDLLVADFFFSRTSSTRNTKERLIATLAYQLTLSVPATRSYIEEAIERDPAIFNKNIQTQIEALLIKPFQSIALNQIFPCQKLIIIDGLDECNDSQSQVSILEAISHSFTQHKLPIIFLVASRPEPDLDTSFNCSEPLRSIHRRLALDETYQPNEDIRLFFSDKFDHIKRTHRLRSTIPFTWPTEEMLNTLISKSSGQFIYASTVVKFVESRCHRPTARLNIILGISPPGMTNPFAELDAIYNHLLSSVDDIQITLRVLSLHLMAPDLVDAIHFSDMLPDIFLSLEPGDTDLALLNLSSIVTYDQSSGDVGVLHASFVDFLSDKRRSTTFYIDKPSTCTDFLRRILQYVKGPDGIQAGNITLFRYVTELLPCVLNDQLQSDILNFDLDAFINASIGWLYYQERFSPVAALIQNAFPIWQSVLHVVLEDGAKKEALDRLHQSLQSRIQIYQSDWRLHLLLTLATTKPIYLFYYRVPYCRCVDILLELLDDHELHIADQNALDLRHMLSDIIGISSYANGDTHASAALHCMRFLSNPPKYSDRNDGLEIGIIYVEWRAACSMALSLICYDLLPQANTSPELVQFISNHDIHPEVQKHCSADRLWDLDMHILAFLSCANVCVNWRIISAIQRFFDRRSASQLQKLNDSSETFDPRSTDEEKDWETTRDLIQQRLDRCCKAFHHIPR